MATRNGVFVNEAGVMGARVSQKNSHLWDATECEAVEADFRAALDRRLDGESEDDCTESKRARLARMGAPILAESIAILMSACLPLSRETLPCARSMGIRFYSLLLLLSSPTLNGRSVRRVAAEAGVSPAVLSKHGVTLATRLGFRSSSQKSDDARRRLSAAQTGNDAARDARERGRAAAATKRAKPGAIRGESVEVRRTNGRAEP